MEKQARATGGFIALLAILFCLWLKLYLVPLVKELWQGLREWYHEIRDERYRAKHVHEIEIEEQDDGGYQIVE